MTYPFNSGPGVILEFGLSELGFRIRTYGFLIRSQTLYPEVIGANRLVLSLTVKQK